MKTKGAAEWVARSSLRRWAKNPRKNDATVPHVAASIRRFGFGAPVLARLANGEIIAGHTRERAAELLEKQWAAASEIERAGWNADAVRVATKGEVVVRYLDLTEDEAHVLALADNKIPELSSFDDTSLAEILRDLTARRVGVADGTGFTDDSVAKLLGAVGEPNLDGLTGQDPGDDRYREQYGVIVLCQDEAEQQRTYEQLHGLGLKCRVVNT